MTTTTSPRTWTPSDRDRMIYRWVKFDGHKQSWVAAQLELNQSTVSRIVDRYERWVAHGGPAQQGTLNRDERLRAQVWLTFERNEWIIASSLRIAGEMEHMSDTSKSTITHHRSNPSREIAVRTENSIRDRTATVCRYLRLAHRVGLDQLQLLDKYNLPDLEPFTLDPNEYSDALADSRSGFQSTNSPFEEVLSKVVPSRREGHEAEPTLHLSAFQTTIDAATPTRSLSEHERLSTLDEPVPQITAAADQPYICNPSPSAPNPEPRVPEPMPATHNQEPTQSPLTTDPVVTFIQIAPQKKPIAHAYALPQNPPETTDSLEPVLEATTHQPPPPIRILPLYMPLTAP